MYFYRNAPGQWVARAQRAPHTARKDNNAMAYVPGPNVLQVELIGSLHAQAVENTLYFFRGGEWSDSTFSQLVTQLLGFLAESTDALSNDLNYTRIEGTDLTTQSSPTYSAVIAGGQPGGVTSPALPGNVAYCVSFRTNGRGRSSRGRNYVPGLPENAVTGNTLNSANINILLAAYTGLISRAATLSAQWGVFSRFNNGIARNTGLFQPITQVVAADIFVDSQRRRLAGRGPAG